MSDERPEAVDASPPPVNDHAADDVRREWVAPAIAELPVTATRGTINIGADNLFYS